MKKRAYAAAKEMAGVATQLPRMEPTYLLFTAFLPRVRPTPMTLPTVAWLRETGIPSIVHRASASEAETCTTNAWSGSSVVMLFPIVRTTRLERKTAPRAIHPAQGIAAREAERHQGPLPHCRCCAHQGKGNDDAETTRGPTHPLIEKDTVQQRRRLLNGKKEKNERKPRSPQRVQT
jgi:hypothetical protein